MDTIYFISGTVITLLLLFTIIRNRIKASKAREEKMKNIIKKASAQKVNTDLPFDCGRNEYTFGRDAIDHGMDVVDFAPRKTDRRKRQEPIMFEDRRSGVDRRKTRIVKHTETVDQETVNKFTKTKGRKA